MTYTVKYKKIGSFFWNTVKNVKGDITGSVSDGLPGVRVLILNDESRMEIPCEGTVIKFSRERFLVIRQNMERESGQQIPVNANLKG